MDDDDGLDTDARCKHDGCPWSAAGRSGPVARAANVHMRATGHAVELQAVIRCD